MPPKIVKGVTMGMDPEFLFLDSSDRIRSAGSMLRNEAAFGLGCDGCSTLAEIRPEPSEDVMQVVNNTRRILQTAVTKKQELLNYKWRAGSYYDTYALGGHIHFGHASFKGSVGETQHVRPLVSILDKVLSPLILLMESKAEARRRRKRSSYGKLHSYRSQPWGFEYRTLPSFVVSPIITGAILGVAKLLAEGAIQHNIPLETRTEISNLATNEEMFDDCNKIYFRHGLTRRMEIIRSLEGYEGYKPMIQVLYRLIKNGVTFEKFEDMKESWDIPGEDLKAMIAKMKVEAKTAEEVFHRCLR